MNDGGKGWNIMYHIRKENKKNGIENKNVTESKFN